MEFLSTMAAKEHLQYSPQLLAEALHMCKILRDRNHFYHETLQDVAKHRNYPDSKPDEIKTSKNQSG